MLSLPPDSPNLNLIERLWKFVSRSSQALAALAGDLAVVWLARAGDRAVQHSSNLKATGSGKASMLLDGRADSGVVLGQPSIDRFLKPEALEIKEVPENTTGLLKIDVTVATRVC